MKQEALVQLPTSAESLAQCHFLSGEHVHVDHRKALQNGVHVVDGRRRSLGECCIGDVAEEGQVTEVVELHDDRRGGDDPVRLVCASYPIIS